MLSLNDFIRLRESDWQRLQTLISRRQGRGGLSAAEIRELAALYRAVTSDLALARRDYGGQRVTQFLNQLLTQTHSYLYQEDTTNFKAVGRYFTHHLPQTFRHTWRYTLIAFLLFIIPAVIAFRLMSTAPENADIFGLSAIRETLRRSEIWTNIPINERPYASVGILTNNIQVALLAFAGGITFGLFSIYVLITNGLSIGGVLGLAVHYGLGETLLKFVLGHGVIELTVIFIAGGAGLQLGWALLNPGLYTRLTALTLAARRALALIVAAIPLLIIAGLIEGFFSPSTTTPFIAHLAVGLLTGALLFSYLLLAGHSTPLNEANETG